MLASCTNIKVHVHVIHPPVGSRLCKVPHFQLTKKHANTGGLELRLFTFSTLSLLLTDLSLLPTRGPCSKYELDLPEGQFRGKLIFTVQGGILRVSLPLWEHTLSLLPRPLTSQGIACDIDSDAFKKLDEATRDVLGESHPYSITGSLPLVGDLQKAGFDIQVHSLSMSH